MHKIHRFIGSWPIATGTLRIDDAELAHQLRSVLRLEPGEMVTLCDGRGTEAQCRILRYDHGAVIVEGMLVGKSMREPNIKVTLYCAILKAEHFELAAQKAAEVGVAEIVPLLTSRTVKKGLRVERVRSIVREAAEVAGRGIIPTVHEILPLEKALSSASGYDVNFFFDPSGKPFSGVAKSVRRAGVWIGPEGGWEEEELQKAQHVGMRSVSLGRLILRAETAVTVATYLVANSPKS